LSYGAPILCSSILQKLKAPAGEKPEPVRTHLRNMIIVPEMISSVIGVYNGKTFNQVEIKVMISDKPLHLAVAMKYSCRIVSFRSHLKI
jgi:ribosomal protein S19